jgi:DNA-binding transcriptional MerR regulator
MAESELSVARRDAAGERRLTIGAVCSALKEDFPDISISKIRYLEDQKLLAPRRTRGGYRLYSVDDVERLRRILKLQRDEFLPLRVIREELDRPERDDAGPASRRRRASGAPPATGRSLTLAEVTEQSGATPELVRELEDFSLLVARDGRYRAEDAQIAAVAAAFGAYGVGARHLRAFHGAIMREEGLLEQLLSPSLRARNPERRGAGLEEAETLAALCAELTELILLRDLRRIGEHVESTT